MFCCGSFVCANAATDDNINKAVADAVVSINFLLFCFKVFFNKLKRSFMVIAFSFRG
jgi:hypothetical protein